MSISEQVTQLKQDFDDVKQAGYDKGYAEGKSEGGGGDNYYDTFWDAYQPQSGYKAWSYKYAGSSWNDKTFTPKYSERPTGAADYMFKNNACKNIRQAFASRGNVLDISGCTSAQNMFANSVTSELGILDMRNLTVANSASEMVGYCGNLTTIEKVISSKDTYYAGSTFASAKLANIIFEGKIGKSISFASCAALTTGADGETTNSVQSIIDTLMTITDDVARTIQFHQDVRDKLTPTQEDTIVNVKKWTLLPARTVTAE